MCLSRLDEDLWYVLKDRLEGVEANGKLKGLKEGDGFIQAKCLYSNSNLMKLQYIATYMSCHLYVLV